MKGFIFVILVLLFVSSTYGATLHGTIYDDALNPVQGVIVEVDSSPVQRHISKYGGYSFELQSGNYTLTVLLSDQKIILAEEEVAITGSGDYVVDLHISELIQSQKIRVGVLVMWVMLGLLIILVVILSLIIHNIMKRKHIKPQLIETKQEDGITPEAVKVETGDDVLKKRILKVVFDNNNKITQKEIRKKISLSEAKISQILSELVDEGKLKKIKQGRINILVITKVS